MKEEILEELKNLLKMLKPSIDTNVITLQSRLLEDLGLDSLTQMLLSLGIEKKYNMRFDNNVQFKTVLDVVECVMKTR